MLQLLDNRDVVDADTKDEFNRDVVDADTKNEFEPADLETINISKRYTYRYSYS